MSRKALLVHFVFAALLMSCVSEDKTHEADLHLQIGSGHLSQGHYPEAIRELRISESLNPDNPVLQNNMAIALYARNRFADAETHFLKALDLKPDYTDARNNLGRL